ncbi:MAG: amidohydrolase [Clostridiales bacterium]|nr:amidohydrolase [Clostridiales bacterium]
MEGKRILQEAKEILDWLIDIRRDFHENPELSLEEFRTQEKIINYLKGMGIKDITKMANTGVVATIKGKKLGKGKVVALRADMDALPIKDNKSVPYKSKIEGKMHACGHDAHMTILLGAARILKSKEDNFSGVVKLIFQPAEETVGGADIMIESGVLDNPRVDSIFGLHVSSEIPTGHIGIRYGQMNAASDEIKITIEGVSTHGAYPHDGVDAIVVSAQVISVLQTIVSRNVDPRKSAVLTLGTIRGGTQENIVANKVEMTGTIRTLDMDTRKMVIDRLKKTVENVAEGFGAIGIVEIIEGYPHLINDNNMVEMVENNAIELLGHNNIHKIDIPSLGVEDFGYFLQKIPGAFYRLGCRNEVKGIIHQTHNDLFDIDEDCLAVGVALQVKNALKVLD